MAPSRVYSLLKNAVQQSKTSATAMNDMKSLFTSSDYVLSQLFPVHNKKLRSDQQQHFRVFNLSSFHRRPWILEIIHDEISLKKKSLQQFRSQQAASLGVLLLTPPQFQQESDFTAVMSQETKQCIEMMKYVLDSTSEKNTHHLRQQLSSMDATPSIQEMAVELNQLVKNWSTTYNQRLQSTQSLYGTPSQLTRYWIPVLASYICGSWAIRYGFKRKDDIIHYAEEFGKTAHDFILNWIWEPMVKVYNTIRLKDQRLSLLSKEGLQSDLNVCL